MHSAAIRTAEIVNLQDRRSRAAGLALPLDEQIREEILANIELVSNPRFRRDEAVSRILQLVDLQARLRSLSA